MRLKCITVLVVGGEPVMVEGYDDDVSSGLYPLPARSGAPHERQRNQRQRFAKAKRVSGLHQFPFLLPRFGLPLAFWPVRKDICQISTGKPVGICVVSRLFRRDEFRHEVAVSSSGRKDQFPSGHLTDSLRTTSRQHVAAISPVLCAIDDVFSGIGNGISGCSASSFQSTSVPDRRH